MPSRLYALQSKKGERISECKIADGYDFGYPLMLWNVRSEWNQICLGQTRGWDPSRKVRFITPHKTNRKTGQLSLHHHRHSKETIKLVHHSGLRKACIRINGIREEQHKSVTHSSFLQGMCCLGTTSTVVTSYYHYWISCRSQCLWIFPPIVTLMFSQ